MKNQYFGDINDYRKYGLLRCFADAGFRLGVCWMLTPSDGSSQGSRIPYLNAPDRWRRHDPDLFDFLRASVADGGRDVGRLEASGLLRSKPDGVIVEAAFFPQILTDDATERERYTAAALKALAKADILFFDPDNGIEVPSVPYGRKNSCKYLYWREVEQALETGASLILFQHWSQNENRQAHAERLSNRLRSLMPQGSTIFPIRTPYVLFLAVSPPAHQVRLTRGLDLIAQRWGLDLTTAPQPTNGLSGIAGHSEAAES